MVLWLNHQGQLQLASGACKPSHGRPNLHPNIVLYTFACYAIIHSLGRITLAHKQQFAGLDAAEAGLVGLGEASTECLIVSHKSIQC